MAVEDVGRELIKKILEEELPPALEKKAKEIEVRIMASTTAFHDEMRKEVRRDHAENRTRLQQGYDQSTKAVAQNEFLIREVDATKGLVQELLSEVKTFVGRQQGKAETEARYVEEDTKKHNREQSQKHMRFTILKWLGGILASSGVLKWLSGHHWGSK